MSSASQRYVRTTPPLLSPARRKPVSTNRTTTPDPERHCHGQSTAESCASSRREVLHRCLCESPEPLAPTPGHSSLVETYQTSMCALEGSSPAYRRKRFCRPPLTQGISRWEKNEPYGSSPNDCSSTQVALVCWRTRHCRCCRWLL